ncbi:MAG: ribosome maturation factor RimM [Flavobacteriales bacterium]|jgi:16S rRNA processing protein RimM
MTPDKSELHELGYFTKLHGYKGELTAYLDTEVLNEYQDVESIFVEVKGQLIPYFVESLSSKTNKTVKVKLEGVDTEDLAKSLVKAKIFILKEDLSETDETRVELRSILGYEVIDHVKGNIGRVHQILELAGNPQLEIDFNGKMILLPLHEDFIKAIDNQNKKVEIEAPEGLIDLFL